jgi:molybdopterin-guanine dinucleotide biosynthesis adapter protein
LSELRINNQQRYIQFNIAPGSRHGMKIFGVAGTSGSGKTTLLEKVIAHLSCQGIEIAAIKHSHHDFEIDLPGKDSHRLRMAGARAVLVSSPRRLALIRELSGEEEVGLDHELSILNPCDLVLVEGYRYGSFPKLEVYRPETGKPPRWPEDDNIIAVASDMKLQTGLPQFHLEDIAGIARFILENARENV